MTKTTRLPLSTGEAAQLCGVSQQTIIRCFDTGKLKGYRVPGSKFRRIPLKALFAFMTEHKIPTDHLLDSLSAESREELLGSVPQPLKILVPEVPEVRAPLPDLPADRRNRVAGLLAIAEGTG